MGKIPGATNLISGVNRKREAFKTLAATAKTATTKAVKSLIPEEWLKRLGTKGTAQAEKALASADAKAALKQGGQKAKELPVAVALAVSIAGASDIAEAPISFTLKQLNLLKVKFKWIKSFRSKTIRKNIYNIYLIASEIPIYESYRDIDLSKYKYIDSQASSHIFGGEVELNPITGNREAMGWHLESTGNPDNARIVKMRDKAEKDKYGVYSAKIELKDPKTGEWLEKGSTTFFPKKWTPQQVLDQIDSAFKNITSKTAPSKFKLPDGSEIMSYVWEGISDSGVPIKGFFDVTNSRIISAFPMRTKK